VPLPLRPELFADFHMGAIGGCSGRNLDPWMMRRSFRFSRYGIEWNCISTDLVDHAANHELWFSGRGLISGTYRSDVLATVTRFGRPQLLE
jgi:hypothetical protein